MRIIFTHLILLINLSTFSQTIQLSDSTCLLNVADKSLIYTDTLNTLNFNDIKTLIDQKFTQNSSNNLTYTKGSLWAKLRLENKSNKKFYLKSSNTAISNIEVYKIDRNGNVNEVKTGIFKPFRTREFDNTQFIFDVTNTDQVYIKVSVSMKGSNVIPLSIYDEKTLFKEINNVNLLNGIYFGVLLLIIIICIFNYVYLRDTIYITYMFFIFSNLIIINFTNGNLSKYIFTDFIGITNYPMAITMWASIFYNLFMIDYLKFSEYAPKARIVNYTLISLTLVVIVADFFEGNLIILAPIIVLANHIFSLIMSIIILKKGYKPALFYILGNIFVFIGTFALFGLVFDLLPTNIFTINSLQICLLFEMVFFTLGLANKTYQLKNEKEEAWLFYTKTLEENQNILLNQKENLEKQVQDRTFEIEAQNEELKQQQEELNSLNENLNHQRITIEEQNVLLKSNNELLETKIKERTKEILYSNNRLTKQNKLLEQYTYITSHNLRGPIARILGLNNVLDILEPSNPTNTEILKHLNTTTIALDSMVKDLSIILNVNKDLNVSNEPVDFEELVKSVKSALDTSILRIDTNFKELKAIQTVKPYIQSIFYNLISNAIKYSSKDRVPFLSITSTYENDMLKIIFEDNGIGMDLDLVGDRIFKAFERFHSDSIEEGKGIGLFLVNLQVENLEGKLEIESKLDIGTKFIILLPQK